MFGGEALQGGKQWEPGRKRASFLLALAYAQLSDKLVKLTEKR